MTLAAFIVLPLAWPASSAPSAEGDQALLQAWFARTGHHAAGDPYFLYAASNAGSFVALLAYPLLIEPFFGLRAQSLAWAWGFAGLLLALALCAGLALAGRGSDSHKIPAPHAKIAISWRDRLAWIGLASVPSGLLVATTAYISTDIAAAPLLWVAPLALFLLTFILAFRDRLPISHRALFLTQALLAALALIFLQSAARNITLQIALHLLLLFVASLSIHHELYRRRPPVSALTDFYVCMSLGGALGGLFAVLAAPVIFSGVHEYPILIAVTFLCLPGAFGWSARALRTSVGFSIFAGGALVALYFAAGAVQLNGVASAAVIASLAAHAFSSDAIPAHLLTREAVALYLGKLASNGVIVLHISNRAMDLRATLARVAADAGLVALHRFDFSAMNEDYRLGSRVVVLARKRDDIGALALDGGDWSQLEPDMSRRVWSDDYSTILTPVLDMIRDK